MFFKGDKSHTGLDNITFFDATHVAAVEDAGDGLHTQRNGLDSAFMFDTRADYSDPKNAPVRFLAQGRDASATIDSGLSGLSPIPADFKNEGDNEVTGIHVSDGDASTDGILGAKVPRKVFSAKSDWRVFYTGQHGDNVTYEIIGAPHGGDMNGQFDR